MKNKKFLLAFYAKTGYINLCFYKIAEK